MYFLVFIALFGTKRQIALNALDTEKINIIRNVTLSVFQGVRHQNVKKHGSSKRPCFNDILQFLHIVCYSRVFAFWYHNSSKTIINIHF